MLRYSENLLAASAWYQGALPNHQHQADQHDQEDPAIQKRHHQIYKMINFRRLTVACGRKTFKKDNMIEIWNSYFSGGSSVIIKKYKSRSCLYCMFVMYI